MLYQFLIINMDVDVDIVMAVDMDVDTVMAVDVVAIILGIVIAMVHPKKRKMVIITRS